VAAHLDGTGEVDAAVTQATTNIKQALELEGTSKSFFNIFRHSGQHNFRRMLLGVGGLFTQQMTAIK
jgi:hypothetical protein